MYTPKAPPKQPFLIPVLLLISGVLLTASALLANKFDATAINGLIAMLNNGLPYEEIIGSFNYIANGNTFHVVPTWLSSLLVVVGFALIYLGAFMIVNKQANLNLLKDYQYWDDFSWKSVKFIKKIRKNG